MVTDILAQFGGRPIDPKELKHMLELKADRVEVSEVTAGKANQEELTSLELQIDILHSFLKHLVSVLLEYVMNELPNPEMTEHRKTHSKAAALMQLKGIANWVYGLESKNPQEMMNELKTRQKAM